jgi:excisionase family DNA binding protein
MNFTQPRPLAYTVKQACALSTFGKTTLYRLAADGKLRLTRVGGRTVIPADSLHALLDAQGVEK